MTEFAPTGVRGMVVAGLIAAVMAALSGLVNSTSTMFSTDIYKKFIRREATDREMVRMGRMASFAALLIAACISPIVGELGGVFKFFQNALTYIACPFMATVLMGILWKRVNYAAGLFGLVGGFFIEVTLGILFSGYIAPLTVIKDNAGIPTALQLDLAHPYIPYLHFFYVGGIGEVIIIIGMVAVTLLTNPPDYARVARFIWRPQLLRAYDEGVSPPMVSASETLVRRCVRDLALSLLAILVSLN